MSYLSRMAKAKKKTASKGKAKAKPAAKKPAKKVAAKSKAAAKKPMKAAAKKPAPKKKAAAKKPAAKKQPAATPVDEGMIAHEETNEGGWVDENVAPPVEHMPEQEEPHDEQMLD